MGRERTPQSRSRRRNPPIRGSHRVKTRDKLRSLSVRLTKNDDLIGEVFFALCKELNTPISLGLWLRYKHGEFRQVAEFELPIRDYLEKDAQRFSKDYLAASYLKKFKGLRTGINLADQAIRGFISSEIRCKETNRALRDSRRGSIDPRLSAYLLSAKRKIADLLGPCSLHCIDTFFGWGPGATYDLPRRRAQVDTKITTIPMSVSGLAKSVIDSVIRQDLHWSSALLGHMPSGPFSFMKEVFLAVDCCRVDTVPKSSKTDRVIAIEPTGNLFLQKGIGGYFRRRLKRRGVDLDDQRPNQLGAKKALSDGLATLDLKAASDTVSLELVYELLPLDWSFLLDDLRSKKALMPNGTVTKLEKLSSMGNGFTFELESLIFWALGMSVIDQSGSSGALLVYGDDIVISKEHAPELIRLLQFVGFDLNKDKSFVDGLFYESCGEHYFNGYNVTPVYQKEVISDGAELIRAHNRLFRWAERQGGDPKGFPPVARLRREADESLSQCVIPLGDESDTGFLSDLAELLAMASRLDANRGAKVRSLTSATRSLPGEPAALLAHTLRNHADFDPTGIEQTYSLPSFLREAEPQASPLWEGPNDPLRSDNVVLAVSGDQKLRYGHRWVATPGYCPLPRR